MKATSEMGLLLPATLNNLDNTALEEWAAHIAGVREKPDGKG